MWKYGDIRTLKTVDTGSSNSPVGEDNFLSLLRFQIPIENHVLSLDVATFVTSSWSDIENGLNVEKTYNRIGIHMLKMVQCASLEMVAIGAFWGAIFEAVKLNIRVKCLF